MERPTLLIVDDDQTSLNLLTKLVSKLNYNVLQALDGATALKVMKKERVNLVIADYDMPKMNGIELLKNMKADFPTIPFILVTAHNNTKVIREAWDAGAFDFFSKPVFIDRLNQTLRLAIECKAGALTRRKFSKLEEAKPEPELLNVGVIRELALALDREDLMNLFEEFDTNARIELEQLFRNSVAKNHNEVRFLAHRLCGASMNLGLMKFEESIRKIENNPQAEITNAAELEHLLERSMYWLRMRLAQVIQKPAA